MANKYYSNHNAWPNRAIPTPPPPGTKGVKVPAPQSVTVTEEPKKGLK
jgi:hypothetical protein